MIRLHYWNSVLNESSINIQQELNETSIKDILSKLWAAVAGKEHEVIEKYKELKGNSDKENLELLYKVGEKFGVSRNKIQSGDIGDLTEGIFSDIWGGAMYWAERIKVKFHELSDLMSSKKNIALFILAIFGVIYEVSYSTVAGITQYIADKYSSEFTEPSLMGFTYTYFLLIFGFIYTGILFLEMPTKKEKEQEKEEQLKKNESYLFLYRVGRGL